MKDEKMCALGKNMKDEKNVCTWEKHTSMCGALGKNMKDEKMCALGKNMKDEKNVCTWEKHTSMCGALGKNMKDEKMCALGKNMKDEKMRALAKNMKDEKMYALGKNMYNNSFENYTDEDWKKRLSPKQYRICREKGTEPPWSGELLDNKQPGIYSCVCCDADLFDWSTKFDSESGWPSFWSAIELEQTNKQKQLGLPNLSVDQVADKSHGMVRVEVLCSQCGSHLGHVFSDGPKPTGLRYCINSVSLKFKPSVID
ncbi:peptide-methionine (R)-S-oxide reductase [Paramuricea clavata]|uniref:Peptide-methionine (R)-S-oxide reductase n=1 Tax=Paramuricea clavata TaxID=317549 RepID=A0A6S7FU10_PARCT|nr:peptide-methionine (R)-S-oxide reductase [Paramuricea clavata]